MKKSGNKKTVSDLSPTTTMASLEIAAQCWCESFAKRLDEKQAVIDEKQAVIDELQDFAIWMTGCGYEFTQHEHFNTQRDKLLKGDSTCTDAGCPGDSTCTDAGCPHHYAEPKVENASD